MIGPSIDIFSENTRAPSGANRLLAPPSDNDDRAYVSDRIFPNDRRQEEWEEKVKKTTAQRTVNPDPSLDTYT